MEKILNQIENILGRVNTHPDYSKTLKQKFVSYLGVEAGRHSINLELNSEKGASSLNLDKEREMVLRQLDKAKNFLYSGGISLYSLSKLGNLVEPDKNPTGSFRVKDVRFGSFIAPEFTLVPSGIENLVYQLNEANLNPVLRAINAHLTLVQVHPYMDGNGRVARLLQNFCLEQKGLPPIIIQEDEGELYRNLINSALQDRYSNKSQVFSPSVEENRFNLYLSTKVLESARSLEEELSKNKRYAIILSGIRDRGILRTLTNSLRSESNKVTSKGSTFSERSCGGRSYEVSYQGPLASSVMAGALEKLSDKYRFKFEIKYPGN